MTDINEDHRRELSRAIASWYVRKDNKYYRGDAPGVAISQPDVRQASFARTRRFVRQRPNPAPSDTEPPTTQVPLAASAQIRHDQPVTNPGEAKGTVLK